MHVDVKIETKENWSCCCDGRVSLRGLVVQLVHHAYFAEVLLVEVRGGVVV